MAKDKIVFVRLSMEQAQELDRYVKNTNKTSRSIDGRVNRSAAIRRAVESFLERVRPKTDPSLLVNVFAEEELDRANGDQ